LYGIAFVYGATYQAGATPVATTNLGLIKERIASGHLFSPEMLLAGAAMMNFVFNTEAKWRWGPNHVFNYLGRCCFGIYLWGNILLQVLLLKVFLAPKKPVIDWLVNHIGFGKTYWLIVLGVSLIVPVLSYELIEKPFLKLKGRFAFIKTRV